MAVPKKSEIPAPLVTDEGEWAYWISFRLRRRRRELELTQKDVVERLRTTGIPMTEATYSRAESGKVELAKGASNLLALAYALRCSVTYLVGLTDQPDKWEPDVDFLTP